MDTSGIFVVERAAGGYVPPTLRVGRNEVAPVRPTVHRGHVKPLWHMSDQVALSNSMASGIGGDGDDQFARGVTGQRKEKPVAKEKSVEKRKTEEETMLEQLLEKQRLEEEEEERKAHFLIDRPVGEHTYHKRGSTPPKSKVALCGAGRWEPGQCVAESYPRAVSPDRMPVMPGPRIAVLGLTAKQIGQPASPTQPRRTAKDNPRLSKRMAQVPGGDLTQLARIPKK